MFSCFTGYESVKKDDKQHCCIVLGRLDWLGSTGGRDSVESVCIVDKTTILGVGHGASWTRKGTLSWFDFANNVDRAVLGKVGPCRRATGASFKDHVVLEGWEYIAGGATRYSIRVAWLLLQT